MFGKTWPRKAVAMAPKPEMLDLIEHEKRSAAALDVTAIPGLGRPAVRLAGCPTGQWPRRSAGQRPPEKVSITSAGNGGSHREGRRFQSSRDSGPSWPAPL